MYYSNLLKKDHFEMFLIYKAIFSKITFTVKELTVLFEKDELVKEWKKGHKTTLSNNFHAFLSDQFIGDSKDLAIDATCKFLTRQKNKQNIWVYQVDLTLPENMNTILDKVESYLKHLALTIEIDSITNKVRERCIGGQHNLFIDHDKSYDIWLWYEEQTGELFEDAIVYV